MVGLRGQSSAAPGTRHSTPSCRPWEDGRRAMIRTEAALAGGTRRKTVALAVPIAGLAASLFLPPVLGSLPITGQRALIVTLITILLWTGEILEPGVAALVGVTLLALSRATASLRDALQGFANP